MNIGTLCTHTKYKNKGEFSKGVDQDEFGEDRDYWEGERKDSVKEMHKQREFGIGRKERIIEKANSNIGV